MANEKHSELAAFGVGDRVELHPATDTWMMGDRYGSVIKITRSRVHVKMDKSGRTMRVHPALITNIS